VSVNSKLKFAENSLAFKSGSSDSWFIYFAL
jgi:hypothetical protein